MAQKTNDKTRECVQNKEKEVEINSTEEHLYLMQIYLTEWTQRDNVLWKQIFTFFSATLIVMVLPFANPWADKLAKVLPMWVFPSVGIFMALAFHIVAEGYATRLYAAGEVYGRLIDKLPKEYRRKKIKELKKGVWGHILNWRLSSFICWLMFWALLIIGVVMIVSIVS